MSELTIEQWLPHDLHKGITSAERLLLSAVSTGKKVAYCTGRPIKVDYRTGNPGTDSLDNISLWGESRTLRAEFIRCLLANDNIVELRLVQGITIVGAKILGPINFDAIMLPFPLELSHCSFSEGISLKSANVFDLILEDCVSGSIVAEGLKSSGVLEIRKTRVQGGINLSNAAIAGNLDFSWSTVNGVIHLSDAKIEGALRFSGSTIYGKEGTAILGWRIHVESELWLNCGFEARGAVTIPSARIGGLMDCRGGKFINPNGESLVVAAGHINGHMLLEDGFNARGTIVLVHAEIEGSLRCRGAEIDGMPNSALEADSIEVKGNLRFEDKCVLKGSVNLYSAKIGGLLSFRNSRLENKDGWTIRADGAVVSSNIHLDGDFYSDGAVSLSDVDIEGILSCEGGVFLKPDADALNANRIVVGKDVRLCDKFCAKGTVRFGSAKIGGDLACDKGVFLKPNGDALVASGAKIQGSLFLRRGYFAEGGVCLRSINIGGQLSISAAKIENPDGLAIDAYAASINGSVLLKNNVQVEGGVVFSDARIGDQFCCQGSTLHKPGGNAIWADNLTTGGNVFLNEGFRVTGEVLFRGAQIGGLFECSSAELRNPDGVALRASRISISGDMFLNDVLVDGDVYLDGAKISGQFVCRGASFKSLKDYSLYADRILVEGDALLDQGFNAAGEVRLRGAQIHGALDFSGAKLDSNNGRVLNMQHAQVRDALIWQKLGRTPNGIVDFSHANVGQLADDERSWPMEGCLRVDGFEYGGFSNSSPISVNSRLRWLNLQPEDTYWPRPYAQLARIFRLIGHETDARAVLVKKQRLLRERGKLNVLARIWNHVLEATVGYGYQPQKIFRFIIPILISSSVYFWVVDEWELMQPSKEREYMALESGKMTNALDAYPAFNPLVYSIDTFIPFVNLHQEEYWLPIVGLCIGDKCFSRTWLWLHIGLGWFLSTIAVASISGLIKKE